MNKTQALDSSIKHWKRMIKWAAKQKPLQRIIDSDKELDDSINECAGCFDCALCMKYNNDGCKDCPLGDAFGLCCGDDKSTNLYESVFDSKTWGTWAKKAKKFLKQLESLR